MTFACRFAALVLAALVIMVPSAALAEDGQAAAGLTFAQTEHDFGRIQKIEPLEFAFSFENRSAAPVAIAKVSTSCGCTAAKPEKTEYQPGEKGTITASFNPAGQTGHHESTVIVEDDGGRKYVLTLAADIETLDPANLKIDLPDPVIRVTPDKVNLGTFKVGETALYKVIVENRGDGDLYLTGEDAPNEEGVRLSARPIKKGKKIELTFFYKPDKAGKINDIAVIRSNDPKTPVIKIHLTGKAVKAKRKK